MGEVLDAHAIEDHGFAQNAGDMAIVAADQCVAHAAREHALIDFNVGFGGVCPQQGVVAHLAKQALVLQPAERELDGRALGEDADEFTAGFGEHRARGCRGQMTQGDDERCFGRQTGDLLGQLTDQRRRWRERSECFVGRLWHAWVSQ